MTPGRPPRLVLASASPTRAEMLRRAGVPFAVATAAVDEATVKAAMRAEGADTATTAIALAELKAQRVSASQPGALVIGADQMLSSAGSWFDKPASRAEAAEQLGALRGQEHELTTAAVAVRDGVRLWHHIGRARLAMRPFSDAFLARYLDEAGERVTASVGAYQIEAGGIQLMARIVGDHFDILGLPLLPLLEFLRRQGVIDT